MQGSQNRSAQEHLMYIQEKVNPILEALVTAVLLERPEDPAFFMLKWLCEQTKSLDDADQGQRSGSTAEEIQTVKDAICRLKARKADLLAMRNQEAKLDGFKSDRSTKASEEEEDEEEEEDCPVSVPEPPKNYSRGPRQSVSAEAYGAWNVKDADFKPPVYEKSEEVRERIQKCLEKSFLFSPLDQKDLSLVIAAMKERRTERDTKIICQGEDGECMFVIEEGTVECYKVTPDGESVKVKVCSAGDSVGELALLYNCPRAATVQTVGPALLWELDRETFSRIVKDAADKKLTTYKTFLKKVPLFDGIDDYGMMTIANALKVQTVESPGEQIIKQGDDGDKLFIVLEGEFVAKKAFVPGSQEKKVMDHKVGDYFGELSLLKNEPRAASVYSSSPNAKLLSMERRTFKRLLGPLENFLEREAVRYDESE